MMEDDFCPLIDRKCKGAACVNFQKRYIIESAPPRMPHTLDYDDLSQVGVSRTTFCKHFQVEFTDDKVTLDMGKMVDEAIKKED
jgi:hypothetical protein